MKISMVLGSTEAIKEAVENGLGVSIISRWAARKESKYGTLSFSGSRNRRWSGSFPSLSTKNSVSSNSLEEFLNFLKAYPFDKLL